MEADCLKSVLYHKQLGIFFLQCHFLCPWNSHSCEKQTHFAGCIYIFIFFSWKKAGSGTALSHHFKFLLSLLVFEFVLGLIGYTDLRSRLNATFLFSTFTSVQLFQPGEQDCRGLRSSNEMVLVFPDSEVNYTAPQTCKSSSLSPALW